MMVKGRLTTHMQQVMRAIKYRTENGAGEGGIPVLTKDSTPTAKSHRNL